MFILYRDTGALWDERVGTWEHCGTGVVGTRERCGAGLWGHGSAVERGYRDTGTLWDSGCPTPPPPRLRARARGLVTVAKARSSGRGGGRTPLANQDRPGLGRRPIAAGKQHAPREAGKGRGERRRRPISGREARANPSAGGFGRSFQNG